MAHLYDNRTKRRTDFPEKHVFFSFEFRLSNRKFAFHMWFSCMEKVTTITKSEANTFIEHLTCSVFDRIVKRTFQTITTKLNGRTKINI